MKQHFRNYSFVALSFSEYVLFCSYVRSYLWLVRVTIATANTFSILNPAFGFIYPLFIKTNFKWFIFIFSLLMYDFGFWIYSFFVKGFCFICSIKTRGNDGDVWYSKKASLIGVNFRGLSICLWIIFSFFNPYSNGTEMEPMVNTFIMLFLPACLAIISSLSSKKVFMFISFLWSLPISLYLILTLSIFALFGITCFSYLLVTFWCVGKGN